MPGISLDCRAAARELLAQIGPLLIAEEREACAKISDEWAEVSREMFGGAHKANDTASQMGHAEGIGVARGIAAMIRRRAPPPYTSRQASVNEM